MVRPVIIVHGGAGKWPRNKQARGLQGVQRAASVGFRILTKRGSALDAVEGAVVSLEDNPVFNSGTGSTLNLLGEVETDAAIMDGKALRGGGVALVKGVKNPVRLARLVMEKTDHVLLAGEGAQRIAAAFKLPTGNLKVKRRVDDWHRARAELQRGKLSHLSKNRHLLKAAFHADALDTVGALALDKRGDLAAACSTGGVSLKLPGRIGDSAILGAGLYADNASGAATATGIGEIAIRLAVSKAAVEMMPPLGAQQAAVEAIRMTEKRIGKGLGMLTLDVEGHYGVAHNTPHICWAARLGGESRAGLSALSASARLLSGTISR